MLVVPVKKGPDQPAKPPTGPDQPGLGTGHPHHGVVPPLVPKRLNTAVPPGRGDVPTVSEALRDAAPLPSGFRCLNPSCDRPEPIKWSESRGRPRLFCSPSCRNAYDYERAELEKDLGVVEDALRHGGGTYRQRRSVVSARRRLEVALLRYPYRTARNSRARG